jgi:hypothetical protein
VNAVEWKHQVAVVTGATGGIGASLCRLLAERGAVPVLTGRSEDKLRQLSDEIRGEHWICVLDVTSEESVSRVIREVLDRYGRIDLLINNAGFGIFQRFAEAALSDLAEMMDVNYFGTVRCIKAVLPHMLQAGSGHIVNIASMAGKIGSPKASGYSASKHAVLGFTNCLRQELAGTGVRVSAVNPGPVDTAFFDRADPSGAYVESVRWFMLKPERVAAEVLKAVERNKAEINIPLMAATGVKLYQLFPRLFDRAATRLLDRK